MGGYASNAAISTDMHIFDPSNNSMTLMSASGTAPQAVGEFSLVPYGDKLLHWGGETSGYSYPTDLHVFDCVTSSWSIQATTGTTPVGRKRHAAAVNDSTMCVYGGYGNAGRIYDF